MIVVNNEFNKLNESTKQDNERQRSANETNLTTATCRISVLNSFNLVNAGVHCCSNQICFIRSICC